MAKKKSKLWKWAIILSVLLILSIPLALFVYHFVRNVMATQAFTKPRVAETCSPTNPEYRLLLYSEDRLVGDRVPVICVPDPENNDTEWEPLHNGYWGGSIRFKMHKIAWTKDGEVVLISEKIEPESWAIAYDFKNRKEIAFDSLTPTEEDKPQNSDMLHSVVELINQHGGLHEEQIDIDQFHDQAKEIWYWNVPTINNYSYIGNNR